MRIMQWNTHHGGVGSDGKLNTERIAQAILAHVPDVDVISFNEVEQFDGYGNHDCVAIWCGVLGPDWKGVSATIGGALNGKGQSNALLSRLPFGGALAKGLYKNRSAVAIVLADGTTVVSTHLDNESASYRNVEAFDLLTWLPVTGSSKIALCGDWNCQSGSTEQAVLQAHYKDAWKEASRLGTNTSFNGTGNTRSSRIDAIFYKGLTLKTCDVPDMRMAGILPSDHSPVVATF